MTSHWLTVEQASRVAREIAVRRARTQARVVQLTRDVQSLVDATHDSPDDEHDPEGATIGFERAQASALLAEADAQLAALARAAAALEEGRLGQCESCSATIGVDRLLARPTTHVCVACAS